MLYKNTFYLLLFFFYILVSPSLVYSNEQKNLKIGDWIFSETISDKTKVCAGFITDKNPFTASLFISKDLKDQEVRLYILTIPNLINGKGNIIFKFDNGKKIKKKISTFLESKNKGEPDTAFIGLLDSNLEIELKKGNYFQLEYNGKKIGKDKFSLRGSSKTIKKINSCIPKEIIFKNKNEIEELIVDGIADSMTIHKRKPIQGIRSQLPSCTTALVGCFGKSKIDKNIEYIGEFSSSGEMNGLGIIKIKGLGVWSGHLKNGQLDDWGIQTWKDGSKYIGQYKNGKRIGWGLLTTPNGLTVFQKFLNEQEYDPVNSKNVNNVFPKFMKSFNSLNLSERKNIQKILNGEDLYKSNIDGKWGRNTLNALAGFAVLKFKTLELEDPKISKKIFESILLETFLSQNLDKFFDEKKIDDALKSSLKNCSNDPKLCNEQELCKMATYFPKVIGKKVKVWKDWGGSEEYLKEAKLRGYHCGVFQETCPENVPNCKPINKLKTCHSSCGEYCQNLLSPIPTSKDCITCQDGYRLEITNNIGNNSPVTGFCLLKNCINFPEYCNNEQLCSFATKMDNGTKMWDFWGEGKLYLKEAKRKGLHCNVGQEIKSEEFLVDKEKNLCNKFLETKPKSKSGGEKVKVIFVNDTNTKIQSYWVNYDGSLKPYSKILPGSKLGQETYIFHPWVFYENNNKKDCLANYNPNIIDNGKKIYLKKLIVNNKN